MNGKCAGPDMVCNTTHAATLVALCLIGQPANLTHGLHDRQQHVDMIVGVFSLEGSGRPLQSHPGINVLAWQRSQVIRWITYPVKLCKDEVPDLN